MNPTVVARPIVRNRQTAEVIHGVHVTCQEHMPFVTALCGTCLDWDDEISPDIEDTCVVCNDLARCPFCGAQFGRLR